MLARLSLKFKLTTLVVVLVAVGTYSFGRFAFQGLANTLERTAGLGVLTATKAFAELIEPEWLANLDTLNASATKDYRRIEATLRNATAGGYIKRIDVVRFTGDKVEHIYSEPEDGSLDYVPTGTREQLISGSVFAYKDAGYATWTLKSPGVFFAAWVPVNHNGERIGMVAAYIDAGEVQSRLITISIAIFAVMIFLIIFSGFITYKTSSGFEKTAVTDGLMGIYNHKYFKQRLEQEVSRSRRYGHNTSLVLLDIDFFKRVNDTYGHTTGDIVLKNLAKWISDSCRTTDVVCRYGGEEIVVILTHTGIAGAQEYAERLRIKISQQVNKDPGEGAEFRVTVSVGVAQYEKGMDMIGLIKRADAALYHSKHTGRNRVTVYTDEIPLDLVKDKQNSRSADR